jgi:hypothetical protein
LKPELVNVTGGFDVALGIPVATSWRNGLPESRIMHRS